MKKYEILKEIKRKLKVLRKQKKTFMQAKILVRYYLLARRKVNLLFPEDKYCSFRESQKNEFSRLIK
jgi:hypothetical protein